VAACSFWLRVLLLAVLGTVPVVAALAAPATTVLPPDQGPPPRLRQPNAARLQELRGQRDFQYVEPETRAEQSAWTAFWSRVWLTFLEWLNGRSYRHFWRWVFYVLFLVAGVFVLLKAVQLDLTGLLGRTPRRVGLAYEAASEDIHEVDFASRLAEAEAAGNLRLAVRLGYLQLLKALSDNGLIAWQADKTNHAYLAELPPAGALRADFREITRQFEFVWYGEVALSGALFRQVRAGQRAFWGALNGASRRAA